VCEDNNGEQNAINYKTTERR